MVYNDFQIKEHAKRHYGQIDLPPAPEKRKSTSLTVSQHVFAAPALGVTPFEGFSRFQEAAHAHTGNSAQHGPRTLHSFRPDEPGGGIIRPITDEWIHYISGESGFNTPALF